MILTTVINGVTHSVLCTLLVMNINSGLHVHDGLNDELLSFSSVTQLVALFFNSLTTLSNPLNGIADASSCLHSGHRNSSPVAFL